MPNIDFDAFEDSLPEFPAKNKRTNNGGKYKITNNLEQRRYHSEMLSLQAKRNYHMRQAQFYDVRFVHMKHKLLRQGVKVTAK